MAQKLDERPGSVYDPEEPQKPVKHDDGLEESWNADNSGYDSDNPESKAEPSIAEQEANADVSDGNESATNEDEDNASNDAVGRGYSGKGQKSKGFGQKLKSKKAVAGVSVAGLLAALVIGFVTMLPGIMINQLREVLNRVGDLQTRQSLNYKRTKFARMSDMFSKDGRRGSKIIADMEARGYKFSFDPNDRNRMLGITTPDGRGLPVSTGAAAQHVNDYMEVRHPLRFSRWKTKNMESFYKRYKISRVSITTPTPNDLEDPNKTLNRNLARSADGDEVDVGTRSPTLSEDATQEEIDAVADSEKYAEKSEIFDELDEAVKETGDLVEEIDPDIARAATLAGGDVITSDMGDILDNIASTENVGGKVLKGVKGFGALDIADKVCTVKNRLRAAVTAARTVKAAASMRYAFAFIGGADATHTGDTSSKLLSSLLKRTTAKDANGNPIGASPGFAYAIKKRFSKSKNDTTRSAVAVDGKLTGIPKAVQNSTENIPLTGGRSCGVWQNPITQIGAGVVEVVVAIFSGGSSAAATTAAKQGVRIAVKEALQSMINKTVAKSLVKTLAFHAAIEISFEGIMTLTQLYAEKSMGYNFTTQEKGGQLGDILVSGAGVANKQRSLQAGLVPATTEQYAKVYDEYMATLAKEKSEKSFFARIFDVYDVDSLASTAFMGSPKTLADVGSFAQSGLAGIVSAPTSLAANVGSVFAPKAFAQDSDEIPFDTYVTEGDNAGIELATDPSGNLLTILREDIDAIDPIENLEYLSSNGYIDPVTEQPIGIFEDHVENCVENIDTISYIEGVSDGDLNPGNDCLAKLRDTVRFKAHLAWLDMNDGITSALFPEEIDPSAADGSNGSGSTGLNISGLNGYVVPCRGEPRSLVRRGPSNGPYADWTGIPDSGIIGTNSAGQPIKVYIREACDSTNIKTIFIGGSIHGSENGGQFVAHELLFNAELPSNVRIIAVPEINGSAINLTRRTNANGVDLNRNNDYRWGSINPGNGTNMYKGPSPASEPETQALNALLTSLGRINLSVHYHDNLGYTAASGSDTPINLATMYAGFTPDTPLRSTEYGRVFQSGSLDGWQAQTTKTPTLLIELTSNQSAEIISRHVEAIKALATSGGI